MLDRKRMNGGTTMSALIALGIFVVLAGALGDFARY